MLFRCDTGSIFPSASSYWSNPGANLYSNIAAASASHSMGHHHHPGASTAVSHHTGVSPHLAGYSHYASPWPTDVHWAARSLSGPTAGRPAPQYKPVEWTGPQISASTSMNNEKTVVVVGYNNSNYNYYAYHTTTTNNNNICTTIILLYYYYYLY